MSKIYNYKVDVTILWQIKLLFGAKLDHMPRQIHATDKTHVFKAAFP